MGERKTKGEKNMDVALGMANNFPYTTIRSLLMEDVMQIWNAVLVHVRQQLELGKAVTITGLGTFCLVEEQLDVGNGNLRLVQKPVFQLSEMVTRISHLQYPPVALPADAPVVPLDYVHLSWETIRTPGTLRTCVTETLLFFYCFVMTQQDVDFVFRNIGVLSVRNNAATMRFYADFLEIFDHTGAVINSLVSDPKTKELVIFGREKDVSHNSFGGVIVLPMFALDHPLHRTSVKPGGRGALEPEQEADWEFKCFMEEKAAAQRRPSKHPRARERRQQPKTPPDTAKKTPPGRRVRIQRPPSRLHLPPLDTPPWRRDDGKRKPMSAEEVQKLLQDCKGCRETVAEIRKHLRKWDVGYFWNDLYLRVVYADQTTWQGWRDKYHPWQGGSTPEDAALAVWDVFLEERQRLESIEEIRERCDLGPPASRSPHPPVLVGEDPMERRDSRVRRVSALLLRPREPPPGAPAAPGSRQAWLDGKRLLLEQSLRRPHGGAWAEPRGRRR